MSGHEFESDDRPIDASDERLFDYVDGELDAEAAAAFEGELERDPALRARLELLTQIETGAKALVEEEDRASRDAQPIRFDEAAERLKPAPTAGRRTTRRPRVLKTLAYAAVLTLLVGGLGYQQWSAAQASRPDAGAIYASLEANFQPEYVCSTAEEFEAYTQDAYGVTIAANFDTDVALIGWAYPTADNYSPTNPDDPDVGIRVLMAQSAGGEEVLVFFEAPGDPRPKLDGDGLSVFTKAVGPIRLHEVSPLDEPVALGLLTLSN